MRTRTSPARGPSIVTSSTTTRSVPGPSKSAARIGEVSQNPPVRGWSDVASIVAGRWVQPAEPQAARHGTRRLRRSARTNRAQLVLGFHIDGTAHLGAVNGIDDAEPLCRDPVARHPAGGAI